jgi:hypothetical protein
VLAQKQQLLVRYYLWATDGPWRLPSQLHYDLIDRKVALPQYAGSKQKVLEVYARRVGVDTYSLQGRGTIFTFDEEGYLKRIPAEEVMGFIVEHARQKLREDNVESIEPRLRERRLKKEHQWQPTDFSGGRLKLFGTSSRTDHSHHEVAPIIRITAAWVICL